MSLDPSGGSIGNRGDGSSLNEVLRGRAHGLKHLWNGGEWLQKDGEDKTLNKVDVRKDWTDIVEGAACKRILNL